MTNTTYTSDSIKVLEGLDAVRMRPGMYIGSTGSRGLHHMVWEIVDNAVDEAANGFADLVTVTINPDSSVRITDNGRGVPVDRHPQLKISGVEVVYTQLHAGGKFDNDAYSYSGGLHGVGASVVNALSEWMNVEIHRDGKIYRQQYESVFQKSKNKILPGRPKAPLQECGKTFEHGSYITFMPDLRVFDHINFNACASHGCSYSTFSDSRICPECDSDLIEGQYVPVVLPIIMMMKAGVKMDFSEDFYQKLGHKEKHLLCLVRMLTCRPQEDAGCVCCQ